MKNRISTISGRQLAASPAQAGVTFVELLVTVAIFASIFAFSQINISGLIAQTSVREQATIVASDLRRQQFQAMSGGSQTGARSPAGVHFSNDEYSLFYGDVYDPLSADSFTIELSPNLRFVESTLLNDTIIFEPISGECELCVEGQNQITLESELSGEQYHLLTNRYGVVQVIRTSQ